MITSDIEKFIKYIENDIHLLEERILNEEEELKEIFQYIKGGIPFFSFEFNYFTILVNKLCFGIDIEVTNSRKEDIAAFLERLEIFKKLFIKGKEYYFTKTTIILFNYKWGTPFLDASSLFYLLYYAVFREFLQKSGEISKIVKDLLMQWNKFHNSSRLPIKIISYLPLFASIGEYIINDKFKLVSARPHLKIQNVPNAKLFNKNYISSYFPKDKNVDINEVSPMRLYLIYETDLLVKFNAPIKIGIDNFADIKQEFEIELKIFKEFIQTLYLTGKDFEYDNYIIEYPWWFNSNIRRFDEFNQIIHRAILLDNRDIDDLTKLYSNVHKSGIFIDPQFEILTYRYFQVHNRDYLPDVVLDAFIILELLLTRMAKTEVTFRLSVNGALFIASNWEDFINIKKLLKDLYRLRSKIIHGGNWKNSVTEFKKRYNVQNEIQIIFHLKSILNKVLVKLIFLKLEDPGILDRFGEENFFFETSELISKKDINKNCSFK